MDSHRFGSFTRTIATPRTRRGFLVGLGALLVGVHGAAAQQSCPQGQAPNKKGQCTCPAGTDPCPNGCVDKKQDPENCGHCGTVCPADATCVKGACICPPGGCGATATTTTTAAPTCVAVTPPFTKPVASCSSNTECCAGAIC